MLKAFMQPRTAFRVPFEVSVPFAMIHYHNIQVFLPHASLGCLELSWIFYIPKHDRLNSMSRLSEVFSSSFYIMLSFSFGKKFTKIHIPTDQRASYTHFIAIPFPKLVSELDLDPFFSRLYSLSRISQRKSGWRVSDY